MSGPSQKGLRKEGKGTDIRFPVFGRPSADLVLWRWIWFWMTGNLVARDVKQGASRDVVRRMFHSVFVAESSAEAHEEEDTHVFRF